MIKIFIGTSPAGGCAESQLVLEYSIKKHCSVPYEIIRMKLTDDENSFWFKGKWNTSNWSTPFSGFRYGIPQFNNFEGKAIYQDDDQIWFCDPLKLWETSIPSGYIATGKRLKSGEIRNCVSLIDCERAKNFYPDINQVGNDPMFVEKMKYLHIKGDLIYPIDGNFNNFDGEDQKIEDIKILHLTDMSTNPGVHMAVERMGDKTWYDGPVRKHPRQDVVDIFNQYYEEAISNGFKLEDYTTNDHVVYKKGSQKGYHANNGWH